ncbi:TetR/AcrR family transcriptional regulator [Klebsiella pneumoniae]|nr:TetR/AcrR family transcriptional regulator [Klebsiella pneumoniae]
MNACYGVILHNKKSSTIPKKLPTQERSRATVTAIMQSATYILTKKGWEGLTTKKIAEQAGVNISSLYQFFPNKESIVAELQRQHTAARQAELSKALDMLPQQHSLREVLLLIVKGVIDEHRISPEMHIAIHEELPSSVRLENDHKQKIQLLFSNALKPFMINIPDPEFSTYITSVTLYAIVNTIAEDRPYLLEQQHFIMEIVTLLEKYLSGSDGAA